MPAESSPDGSSTPPGQDPSLPSGDSGTSIPDPATDAADAADAGPKRFCETQAPLTGVVDFFCADFDGTSMSEGFTTASIPDAGGALNRTTDVFSSAPASVSFSGEATLEWSKTAAKSFTQMDVQFDLNVGTLGGTVPPQIGSTQIVRLASMNATVLSLLYTDGGMVEGSPYKGYYVQFSSCPDACSLVQKKITTLLPINTWTTVILSWAKAGDVKISFNGLDVTPAGFSGAALPSAKVTATLGLVSFGAGPGMGRHAFDNFLVSVKR